jgi:hypothetical protein
VKVYNGDPGYPLIACDKLDLAEIAKLVFSDIKIPSEYKSILISDLGYEDNDTQRTIVQKLPKSTL